MELIAGFISAVWRSAESGEFLPKICAILAGLFVTTGFAQLVATASEKFRNARAIMVIAGSFAFALILSFVAYRYSPPIYIPPCGGENGDIGFCAGNSEGTAWIYVGSYQTLEDAEIEKGAQTYAPNVPVSFKQRFEKFSEVPGLGAEISLNPNAEAFVIFQRNGRLAPFEQKSADRICSSIADEECVIRKDVSPSDLCTYRVIGRHEEAGPSNTLVYLQLRQGCPQSIG